MTETPEIRPMFGSKSYRKFIFFIFQYYVRVQRGQTFDFIVSRSSVSAGVYKLAIMAWKIPYRHQGYTVDTPLGIHCPLLTHFFAV